MAFSDKLLSLKHEVLQESEPLFKKVEEIAEANTLKVLDAMRECMVSDSHFNTTSGYAYDDIGRGKLEELYARILVLNVLWCALSLSPALMPWPRCSLASCGPVMSWYL